MLKGIILDKDGVIIDSEPIKLNAYEKAFEKITGIFPDVKLIPAGATEELNMISLLKHYNVSYTKEKVMELMLEKRRLYQEFFHTHKIPLIKGILDFIIKVKKKGLKLGLCTSCNIHTTMLELKKLGIIDYFDEIVSSGDIDDPEHAKPHPRLYKLALKKLNLKPNEVIAIEDSPKGIQAAISAGIKVVGITTAFTKEEISNVDLIIDEFKELNVEKLESLLLTNP
jgi:HAD superfamily hydrolase (TIGR01509 family)